MQGCHRKLTAKAGDRMEEVTVKAVSTALSKCKAKPKYQLQLVNEDVRQCAIIQVF